MALDYETPWLGGSRRTGCDCTPTYDDKGLKHRGPYRGSRECPSWVPEWRRRAAYKDMTHATR